VAGALSVIPTADGFEFGATLNNASAATTYAYALDAGSLQATLDTDGQSVLLIDPAGVPAAGQSGPDVVGRIGAPGLVDATGLGSTNADISVALVHPGDTTYPAGVSAATVSGLGPTEVLLVYAIAPSWLTASVRTFPVSLDPSICIQNGGTGCTNTGYLDTYLMAGMPQYYPTGRGFERVGVDARGTGFGLMRSLVFFPSASLCDGTGCTEDGGQVISASLTIHQMYNYGTGTMTLAAQRMRNAWTGESTWAQVNGGGTTVQQATANSCGGHGSDNCTDTFDVTAIVRDLYTNRAADWMANLGFMLVQTDETKNEIDFDLGTASPVTNRPLLTINYVVPQTQIDFATELGPNYAPSAMPAGQVTNLPIVITNNGSGFTFNDKNNPDSAGWYYKAGYRWFDQTGKLVTSPAPGTQDLPSGGITDGHTGAVTLAVTAPPTPGSYTLRLDLVHVTGADCSTAGVQCVWASDWANPKLFMARDKRSFDPANTRWTGGSVIERDEFSMSVVSGGGTAQGPVKSVTLGDGSTAAVNLWSGTLHVDGSGGVGFNDLDPVNLSYQYDSGAISSCAEILGACGWSTNFDERLNVSTTAPGTYTYQDPSGNSYFVGADGNGQLISSAPSALARTRWTLFDDNKLAWSSPPTYDHLTASSGAFSTKIDSRSTTSAAITPQVPLNSYPLLDFSAKTSSLTYNKAGIALDIYDTNTSTQNWFGYNFGASWSIAGMDWQTDIGGISTSWTPYERNVWNDVNANKSLFGAATDHDSYLVLAVEITGYVSGGSLWFDGAALEPGSSVAFDDSLPTFVGGSGSYASLNSSDKAIGADSLQVTAITPLSASPTVSGLTTPLYVYPFARWYWRKVGGTTIAQAFTIKDVRTNISQTITYYAGENKGYANPIKISDSLPVSWTPVTRDLEDDARQVLGFYNDNPGSSSPGAAPSNGPIPDDVQLTGYELIAYDGQYALFDDDYLTSQTGADPLIAPGSEDFVATGADGSQHYFNLDGLLERIVDRNGQTTTFDWTYDTSKSGQAAYTLTKIHAPSDGMALSSGTAQRDIAVAYASGKVTFTEELGSTTSHSGRATEFDLTSSNLMTVIPAQHVGTGCAAVGTASGCLKFEYTGSNLLWKIRDPRDTGSSGNNFYTMVTYDGTNRPTKITDVSASPDEDMLVVDTYSASSDTYRRVLWQNGPALAASKALYIDLSPDGTTLNEYQPLTCSSSACTPAVDAGDLMASYAFDGVGHYSTETRCQTAGCTSTGGGNQVVSRRGTNAALAVDNLADPLTGAETLWSQSADQYYASVAAGNPGLYRTTYTYNALHEVVDTITPYTSPEPVYSTVVAAGPNLAGYWRLGEPSGSTAADSSSGNHAGTISSSGVSLAQPGALVGDANKAMSFNGSSGSIAINSGLALSGSFTVEAWVKTTSATAKQAIVGSGSYGFALELAPATATNPIEIHSAIGTGGAWLNSAADAEFEYAPGAWYHIVETVGGGNFEIYVNGIQIGSGVYVGTALLADGSHALRIGQDGNASAHWAGSIDEVAVYAGVLSPGAIEAHWAEGAATVLNDVQTLYDDSGNPTSVTDDTYLANEGFEYGTGGNNAGWTLGSSATIYQATSLPDASVHSGTASLKLAANGAAGPATQTVRLVPGQAMRLQFWAHGVSGGHVSYKIEDAAGSTWETPAMATASKAPGGWTQYAIDTRVPVSGDGRIRVSFWNDASAGTGYVDDVDLLTMYSRTTYADGTGATPAGLPTDTFVLNQETPGTTGGIDTRLAYGASSVTPAILPTSRTANYVNGSFDPTKPDEDVISSATYDAWGRTISTTDPDGVGATTTYATNMTDVASTADGVGNVTTYAYDPAGRRTSVTSPLGEMTTTAYDLAGHAVSVTDPNGIQNTSTYTHGLLVSSVANSVSGGGTSGTANLTTNYTYDNLGNQASVISDGGSGLINAETTSGYDLLGNVIQSVVYSDSAHTNSRTTTAYFDVSGSIARPKPSGSRGPIAPTGGRLCPGSTTLYCNSVSVLDMAGRPTMTYDAYGTPSQHVFDLDGHEVRTVGNYSTGTYDPSHPDRDISSDNQFDLNGNLVGVVDVLGHTTSTKRDALGRATAVVRPDNSWTRTDYTPGGRTAATSQPGSSTQGDDDVTWTATLYDAAGRAYSTLANWDRSGAAGMSLFSFEGGVDGWTGSGSGYFIGAPAGAISSDQDTAGSAYQTTAPDNGRGRLRVATSTSGSYSGAWVDLSAQDGGQTFLAGHTYKIHADIDGWSGYTLTSFFGVDASGGDYHSCGSLSTNGHWQTIDCTWTPSADRASNVHFAVRKDASGWINFYLDDVVVWDATATVTTQSNIPTSETIYDADSHPIENVTPPGVPGVDEPMVTASAYDPDGRLVATSVDATDAYSTSIINTASLLDYWPLDERGGTAAEDKKGSNDGTYTGGVALGVAGAIDEARTAASFDGASGNVGFAGCDLTTGDWTIEAWVNPASSADGYKSIVAGATGSYGLILTGSSGNLYLAARITGVANAGSANVTIPTNTWTHVGATFSAAGGTVTYYVNGAAAGTGSFGSYTPTGGAKTNTIASSASGSGFFPGSIDEVALYNAALSGGTMSSHFAAGRETAPDSNLVTANVYDALGRKTDLVDPTGINSHYVYDRLGRVTATTSNYVDGVWSSANPDRDVSSTYAYDALGEMTGYCSAQNRGDAGTLCDPTSGSATTAWHYSYDAAGHLIYQKPPTVTPLPTGVTALGGVQLSSNAWVYDAGNRLTQVCTIPSWASTCANATRYTATTYDAVGRATLVKTYQGAPGSGTSPLSWTSTYQGDGYRTRLVFDGRYASPVEGTTTLTINFSPDLLDRPIEISDGSGGVLTSYTYNADGTAGTRTDPTGTATFGYDFAGRPASVSETSLTSLTPRWSYRLDGLLGSRTWTGSNALFTYTYDAAKRPVGLAISGTGVASVSLSQTYDRDGNVKSEGRTFAGITGDSGNNTASFTYDGLARVVSDVLGSRSISYTYDRDSNRTSMTDGSPTTYVYDAADQLLSQTVSGTTHYFAYDSGGNMIADAEPVAGGSTTTYTYDIADRLLGITAPNPTASSTFTLDPLGRTATRTTATSPTATTDTYSYLGTSETVCQIATSGGSNSTTVALLGSDGSRLATKVGGSNTLSFLVPDLHGNVAAAATWNFGTITDAFRYDAYGRLIAATTSSLPTPWRYQGRMLVSATGAADLYDAGARFYSPGLGTFTQFDSVGGSAQNPISMNRYLYGDANPATLIDPDGHTGICEYIVTDASCWETGTGKDTGNSPKSPATGGAPAPTVPPVTDGGCQYHDCTPTVPTLNDTHRQFLTMCLSTGSDLDECLRRWKKVVRGEIAGDSSSDGPPEIVSTAVGNIQVPADIAKDALWLARFKKLFEGFMARGGGWTEASARSAAIGMVRQQFTGGNGAALEGISDKAGAAALLADTGLTMATCDWSDELNCANQSAKTAVKDYAGLKVGALVGTACVLGLATGPGEALICGCGAVIAGVVTSNVVGSTWDSVACNFDSDCPKLDDYYEAIRLLSVRDSGNP